MNPIQNPSTRRFLAFVLTLAFGALNNKLGLGLSEVELAELLGFSMAYIGQSVVRELKKAKVAGETAAAKVDSPQAAIDAMNAGPQP